LDKRAVVLLSGGIDSLTALAVAKSEGYQCYALSFDYAQRHAVEIDYARCSADSVGVVEHRVVNLGIGAWGGSALTDMDLSVPSRPVDLPSTYVPARNMIFLSVALAWAEVVDAPVIFFGANKQDFTNYPDCRPAFFSAFTDVANLATRFGDQGCEFVIETPLIDCNKADIIRLGLQLGVDYSQAWSCYNPLNGRPCGECDACRLRRQGFAEAGVQDPQLDS
jgi:7-cyano-7-deazaguanine synthase